MADVRCLTLEAALDDWISDYEMQGDYESECSLDPRAAYAEMVRQAVDWTSRGVLVSGRLLADGFAPWSESADENARLFVEAAAELTVLTRPGQICWFDTGPRATDELKQLACG